MVTTVILIVHDGAKMAQQILAKNGLWEPNTNILKITVACAENMIVKMMAKMMVSTEHNSLNLHIHRKKCERPYLNFLLNHTFQCHQSTVFTWTKVIQPCSRVMVQCGQDMKLVGHAGM